MEPILLVVGAVACALAVAWLLRSRVRSRASLHYGAFGLRNDGWRVPALVDRADFVSPEAPWLVAVFTSAACDTCAAVIEKARFLECDEVAVCEIEVSQAPELHERYRIDAVPILIAADSAGVVQRSFVGPTAAADLWSAMAELRGS